MVFKTKPPHKEAVLFILLGIGLTINHQYLLTLGTQRMYHGSH